MSLLLSVWPHHNGLEKRQSQRIPHPTITKLTLNLSPRRLAAKLRLTLGF